MCVQNFRSLPLLFFGGGAGGVTQADKLTHTSIGTFNAVCAPKIDLSIDKISMAIFLF